jgi:hypothetical protein
LGEVFFDFRTPLLQLGDVAIAVKRYPGLPNSEQNPNPTACELSYCRVMLHPAISQHSISGLGPGAVLSSAVGKFVKRLPKILRASESAVNLAFLTAFLCHGRDPTKGRQAVGIFPAVLLRTERAE